MNLKKFSGEDASPWHHRGVRPSRDENGLFLDKITFKNEDNEKTTMKISKPTGIRQSRFSRFRRQKDEKEEDADEDIDTIIHDIDLELGESVEKILFMKMLFDKQEAR